MIRTLRTFAIAMLLLTTATVQAAAQAEGEEAALKAGLRVVKLTYEPSPLTLTVGDEVTLKVTGLDAEGKPVPEALIRVFRGSRAVLYRDGTVTATEGGSFQLRATVVLPRESEQEPLMLIIPVSVAWPPVEKILISSAPGVALYAGTTIRHTAEAFHGNGSQRPDPAFGWGSSDPSVATVNEYGMVTGHRAGSVTIYAETEGTRGEIKHDVEPFPATSLELMGGLDQIKTGDVLAFEAVARGAGEERISDIPITWGYDFIPDDSIKGHGAPGQMEGGKFVAEVPGVYTVFATAGDLTARRVVDVRGREVVREVTFEGQGTVDNSHTSDLWVFEGRDGRDYAVTGTWGADGWAFFWDVTDPTNIVKTDSIRVDARTVNDVKVSPDARYAVLSREGASNRRNGVVILDLSTPGHPTIASIFDDGLTGGVHNMFATKDYLFALSGGDKYVIIDVRDLENPTYTGEYNHPNSSVHDVWVHDGIAYSSEWGNGVVVVDVGNGKWGGSPEKPVLITSVPTPRGATHAAFPYFQKSTGKVYLFLGDEIMGRRGAAWAGAGTRNAFQPGGTPMANSGYVHIIDFTDPENPKDVARYEVKEFGTHNMWVEDDILYQAYYEGGVRMVDVSGELMGDLYAQGREIAVFKSFDPKGYIMNAATAWGAQPHKGYIFFSDFNSGLWAVKMKPKERPTT